MNTSEFNDKLDAANQVTRELTNRYSDLDPEFKQTVEELQDIELEQAKEIIKEPPPESAVDFSAPATTEIGWNEERILDTQITPTDIEPTKDELPEDTPDFSNVRGQFGSLGLNRDNLYAPPPPPEQQSLHEGIDLDLGSKYMNLAFPAHPHRQFAFLTEDYLTYKGNNEWGLIDNEFGNEEEQIKAFPTSIRATSIEEAKAQVQELVDAINSDPLKAEIYGGPDGVLTFEEAYGEEWESGRYGIPGTTLFRFQLNEKFNIRSHAVTRPEDFTGRERSVEFGALISNQLANLGRGILHTYAQGVETTPQYQIADFLKELATGDGFNITGNMIAAPKGHEFEGNYIDAKTGELYSSPILDLFPWLRDHYAWQKEDAWYTETLEDIAYQAPVALPIGIATGGTSFMRWLAAKGIGGEALKDGLLVAPANLVRIQHLPAGRSNKPVTGRNSDSTNSNALYHAKDIDVYANNWLQYFNEGELAHPLEARAFNFLGNQTQEMLGALVIGNLFKLGRFGLKSIVKPHTSLDQLVGPSWRPGYKQVTDSLSDIPILNRASLNKIDILDEAPPKGLIPGAKDNVSDAIKATNHWVLNRLERTQQVMDQMAESQMTNMKLWRENMIGKDPNAGGYKLAPELKQPGQGVVTPQGDPVEILNASNINTLEGNFGRGSNTAVFNPLEVRVLANKGNISEALDLIATSLKTDGRYLDALNEFKLRGGKVKDVHPLVLERIQQSFGRDAAGLPPEEFWGNDFLNTKLDGSNPALEANIMADIISADIINNSVFAQLTDRARATKAILNSTDIFSVDGPMESLADNLIVGLSNVKRSRYAHDLLQAQLRKGDVSEAALRTINAQILEKTEEIARVERTSIRDMMELLENQPDDQLSHAILDAFSQFDSPQNWLDFDAWVKRQLYGGKFNNSRNTSQLLKGLASTVRHSVLTSFGTPGNAILGTTSNVFFRNFNELIGATLSSPFTGGLKDARIAAAKNKAMLEAIPEAWKLFWKKFETNMGADVRTLKNRFQNPEFIGEDLPPVLAKAWAADPRNTTPGAKAAANLLGIQHYLNVENKWTTIGSRILSAVDDSSTVVMSRVRAKELAFAEALEEAGGDAADISADLLKRAEELEFNKLLDEDGNIDITRDPFLQSQVTEATLTQDLGELGQALNKVFKVNPLLEPWFLFARTGIGDFKLALKNAPATNLLFRETWAILNHKGKDFTKLSEFGITNAADLARARNLVYGRQAVGTAITMMAFTKIAADELTGNGPADPQLRQQWINAGWQPNTITFGNVNFEYSKMSPYSLLLSSIADVADNQQLMGNKWATERLAAISFVIGRNATNKTYLSGINDLVEFLNFRHPSSWQKAFDPVNNIFPAAGARNDIGQILNPYMKELNSDMWSSIRNRNQYLDLIPNPFGDPALPKSDILNGDPIRDWNFFQRSFNAVSPIQITIANQSPGRKLLLKSGYDLNSVTMSYGGYNFQNNARVRALFQNAMGNSSVTYRGRTFENLEKALDFLAVDPGIVTSLETMQDDAQNPQRYENDPNTAYHHNKVIHDLFNQAKRNAWRSLEHNPEIIQLMEEQDALTRQNRLSAYETNPSNELLQLNNP